MPLGGVAVRRHTGRFQRGGDGLPFAAAHGRPVEREAHLAAFFEIPDNRMRMNSHLCLLLFSPFTLNYAKTPQSVDHSAFAIASL
jgi:hypothetical protein